MGRRLGKWSGSVTVLACLLFAAMLLAVCVIADRAGTDTARAYGERMLFLGARSLLAEYDRNLWEDYGLFARIGQGPEMEEVLKERLDAMSRKKAAQRRDSHLMFEIRALELQVQTAGGSLLNQELVREQILSLMEGKAVLEGLESLGELAGAGAFLEEKQNHAKGELDREKEEQESQEEQEEGGQASREPVSFDGKEDFIPKPAPGEGRRLQNQWVIQQLPSRDYKKESIFTRIQIRSEDEMMDVAGQARQLLEKLEGIIGELARERLIDAYIFSYMSNALSPAEKETFFRCEAEYILEGNFSDDENYKAVQRKLFLLRTGLNLVHIYTDQEKSRLTMEAAAAVSGPFAAAIQFLISASWAAGEANHDLKLLLEGGKVPLLKKAEDWATELFGPVRSTYEQKEREGLDYQGYLGVFLLLQGSEEKLLRVMDLIQINMKGRYRQDFALRECIAAFTVRGRFQAEPAGLLPGLFPPSMRDFQLSARHSY